MIRVERKTLNSQTAKCSLQTRAHEKAFRIKWYARCFHSNKNEKPLSFSDRADLCISLREKQSGGTKQCARRDALQPDGALHGDAAPKGEKRARGRTRSVCSIWRPES